MTYVDSTFLSVSRHRILNAALIASLAVVFVVVVVFNALAGTGGVGKEIKNTCLDIAYSNIPSHR